MRQETTDFSWSANFRQNISVFYQQLLVKATRAEKENIIQNTSQDDKSALSERLVLFQSQCLVGLVPPLRRSAKFGFPPFRFPPLEFFLEFSPHQTRRKEVEKQCQITPIFEILAAKKVISEVNCKLTSMKYEKMKVILHKQVEFYNFDCKYTISTSSPTNFSTFFEFPPYWGSPLRN